LGIFGDDINPDLDLWSQSAAWIANFE